MTYQKISESLIFHGRIFDLVQARYQLPNGSEHTYDLVKHHGAVTIVPVDDLGNIWFVRQFRLGAQKMLLELPAGLLEEGETPEASAAREVQEEIGMATRSLVRLGDFYMVPGYSTENIVVFLATGLYTAPLPTDDDEFLEKVSLPIAEVYRMARSGGFQDGKTVAALLLAQPYLEPAAA